MANAVSGQLDIAEGVRVTDLVLFKVMGLFPAYFPDKTMATPIMFYQAFKGIPHEFLRLLGVPDIQFDAPSEEYSINNYVRSVFGVDILDLASIAMLVFVSSIVLVSVLLPNLYFRIMLWADDLAEKQEQLSP